MTYDQDTRYEALIADLHRDSENTKVDGNYTISGINQVAAANSIEQLMIERDLYIEKLLLIENLVSQALRNG
jgi:hypothetical protein